MTDASEATTGRSFFWRREGDEFELSMRTGARGVGCFMFVWLTGWSVGSSVVSYKYLTTHEAIFLYVALAMWTFWLVGSYMMLSSFLGRFRLSLNPVGLTLAEGIVWPRVRRQYPLDEVFRFKQCLGPQGNKGRTTYAIEVRCWGIPHLFGSSLSGDDREAVINLLNDELKQLKQRRLKRTRLPTAPRIIVRRDDTSHHDDSSGEDSNECLTITAADRLFDPPSDCRWQHLAGIDADVFHNRGRFELKQILLLAAVSAFWNGIVSVFIFAGLLGMLPGGHAVHGPEWLGLFLFLIPFELIGLFLIGAVLFHVIEPLRVTRWTLDTLGVTCRVSWLGLGWRRFQPIAQLDRVEIHRVRYKDRMLKFRFAPCSSRDKVPQTSDNFSLLFFAPDGKEVAGIHDLTRGEAVWIAQTALSHRWLNWS